MSYHLERRHSDEDASIDRGRSRNDPWVSDYAGTEDESVSWDRYLAAVRRYKWLVIASVVAGVMAAVYAYRSIEPEYVAQGTIWVTNEGRDEGDQGPIRQADLLQSSAWINLMLTDQVLEPVARDQRLYLSYADGTAHYFEDFSLARDGRGGNAVIAGRYRLTATPDGSHVVLSDADGREIERAPAGSKLGEELGFDWHPTPPGPDDEITFVVTTPRQAVVGLRGRLNPQIDRLGSFITVQLQGEDRVRIATVLGDIMERFIDVAARLKRARLEELNTILAEQLDSARLDLQDAQEELEEFRVRTITLPSEESAPIAPGLQQTQGPVMSDFFQRRVQVDELEADIARLVAALRPDENGDVRLAPLEAVPQVGQSSEMQAALDEIRTARAEVRALRQTFTDDYGPVQETLDRLETLETQVVPQLGGELLANLRSQRDALQGMIDSRADELQQIPRRSTDERQLQRRVDIAETLYTRLRENFESARLATVSSTPDVRILDTPQIPEAPVADQRMQWVLLALFGFAGIGVAGAIVLDRMDARLRYATEVSDDLGLRILGVIPRIRVGRKGNASQVREAFRELRLHVEYAYGSGAPLMVAVTSPTEEEGKTTVSANLAMAFAGLGRKTLLIDGDTRRGDLHSLLGCDRKPGLTDYLKGTGDVVQETNQENLSLISSGSRDSRSPDMLSSNRMLSLAAAIKQRYEVVIFDCPPLMAGGDAFVLGAHAGNVLMVVRSGSSRKDLTAAKLDDFLRLPVRILGAVLNDASPKSGFGAYAYYGDYLPGYEARDEEEEPAEPTIRPDRVLTGD